MAHNVRELLREFYGYSMPTDAQSSDVTVGTAAIQLVPANARRAILRLSNNGPAAIYVERAANVTVATGIGVNPGEEVTLDWKEDGDDVTRAWWGISTFAGNAIHVIETILTGADDPGVDQ